MVTTLGIPENYSQKLFWVPDDKRTSHLSHEPGGVALVIVFNNGRVFGYDKIKYPSSYAERAVSGAMGKKIENIYMSSYVETVFVRPESKLYFVQAWSREADTPLKYALKQYDKEMPNNHQVSACGFLNGKLVVSGAAQDSTVPGVPSITSNSFVMPIPKGGKWKVEVAEDDRSMVEIKWFTRTAKLITHG